jgi:predicted phosphodiesterase
MAKKIIFAVITILLVFWIASRWNVWFNKHPEPQFQLTESVCCIQLTVGDNPLTERIVSWRSRPDSALLKDNAVRLIWISDADTLYPKVNKKWIKSGGGEAIYYWSEVEVKEGIYSYAIETIDSMTFIAPIDSIISIDSISTKTPYYTTKVNNPNSLLILVLGDLQDKTINPETDSAVIQLAKAHNPDFILQLGDLIDRPHQDKWDIYYHSFEPLRTSVPIISIVGNHDYHKGINKYPDERFFYTFPYFLEDNNAPTIGCCELDFGNTHLYIIDSNQPIFRQFKQRKWLKSSLEKVGKDVNKIIALHHPLHSARSKFNNLIVRLLFEGVAKQHNVELVLAGHEHTNQTLTQEETGGYNQIITNFSSKNYDDADGENGRKIVKLQLENGKIKFY